VRKTNKKTLLRKQERRELHTVKPLEIIAVSYKRSTTLVASLLSGAFLQAAFTKYAETKSISFI